MAIRQPFEVGEWYHCYSRGIDKRSVFENELDANRFLMALYQANGTKKIQLFSVRKPAFGSALAVERGTPIVSIGAYCLMPNHFHLLLKEITEGGITSFMRKVGTAYTMYFNAKNERVGNLFTKPFRSRHVGTDSYFQRVIHYIHFNPAELYEPGWKSGKVRDMRRLERKLIGYPYSSLKGHYNTKVSDPILSQDVFDISDRQPLSRMLDESRSYYADIATDAFER